MSGMTKIVVQNCHFYTTCPGLAIPDVSGLDPSITEVVIRDETFRGPVDTGGVLESLRGASGPVRLGVCQGCKTTLVVKDADGATTHNPEDCVLASVLGS